MKWPIQRAMNSSRNGGGSARPAQTHRRHAKRKLRLEHLSERILLAADAAVGEQEVYHTSAKLHKPLAAVDVEWSDRLDPSDPAVTHPEFYQENEHIQPVDGKIVYPEAVTPGTDPYAYLGVTVTVMPPIPTGLSSSVFLYVTDPDNALDGALADINDTLNTKDANDNYKSTSAYGAPSRSVPGGSLHDTPPLAGYGSGDRTLEVPLPGSTSSELRFFRVEHPQPGNNWQVVVHNDQEVVETVYYRSGTELMRNNGKLDIVTSETGNQTSILTAARSVWIEEDPMETPTPETTPDDRGLFNGDPLCNGCDDPEPTGNFVGNADLSVLNDLLEPALVDVRGLPSEFNVDPSVPFKHHVGTGLAAETLAQNARDVSSQQEFWVIQMVAAYESYDNSSNDPDVPFGQGQATYGYATEKNGDGGTFVYLEELRDIVADAAGANVPPVQFRQNVPAVMSAHEAAHRFLGPHNISAINANLMNTYTALVSGSDLTFTEIQLQRIQGRIHPV